MSRLERWSRRKRGDERGTHEDLPSPANESLAEEPSADPEAAADPRASSPAETTPEPGSLDDSLPDPETFPPGSDIKAFLEPGVSSALRRRALRRLFSGDQYGIRDGLDDYDHDYHEKLKPLSSELAQRLRQWSRPVEEETDTEESAEETAGPQQARPQTPIADEAPPEWPPEAGDDGVVTEPDDSPLDQGRVGTYRRNSQE